MKSVYLFLNKKDELEMIIKLDSQLSDAGYKRAWEIIHQLEGHDAFIAELQNYNQQ